MKLRDRAAQIITLLTKGNPTGSSLHVPAPIDTEEAAEEKKRQRRKDVAKALRAVAGVPDPGMYVGRMVLNAWELQSWWRDVRRDGEPELDPFPHVTIVYSTTTFPWVQDRTTLVVDPLPEPFGLLGPKNALVVKLDSQILADRWDAARRAGATVTYDSFKPHCTLFYLGAGYDSTSWRDGSTGGVARPPSLVLGPEIIGPRGVDVFQAADAPSWYRESRGVTV